MSNAGLATIENTLLSNVTGGDGEPGFFERVTEGLRGASEVQSQQRPDFVAAARSAATGLVGAGMGAAAGNPAAALTGVMASGAALNANGVGTHYPPGL